MTVATLDLEKLDSRSLKKKLVDAGKKYYGDDNVLSQDDYIREAEDEYWSSKDASIVEVLKTGKSPIKIGKQPIFNWDQNGNTDEWQTIDPETGIIYYLSGTLTDAKTLSKKGLPKNYQPEAVVAPFKNAKQKFLLILNGDENPETTYLDAPSKVKNITISFECLRRFYGEDATIRDVAVLLQKQLKVVDCTEDSEKYMNDTDIELFNKWVKDNKVGTCPVKPPAPGYTLVGHRWHRSATVLFYDSVNKYSILIGQDEGTYFGVELADNPKTIAEAYKSLMPEAVRKLKYDVPRQGEWFAVAVEAPPAIEDCVLEQKGFVEYDERPYLNRDSEASACHYVQSSELRIGKDGIVYALDATLTHQNGDHQELTTKGWVAYHRNTAVRAFSVEGVD